jgi:outer membrane protein OmpA-like peptidoglycan-associated protein
MKSLLLASFLLLGARALAQFGNLGDRVRDAGVNRANQKIDQGINKAYDKAEEDLKNGKKKRKTGDDTSTQSTERTADSDAKVEANDKTDGASSAVVGAGGATGAGAPVSLRSYANYDFVPGGKILFEDDFSGDQDGEFAQHWDLIKGQAVLNKMGDGLVMKITDGNYGVVAPLMKEKAYLPKEFTLEYDYYQTPGAYGLQFWFKDANDAEIIKVRASRDGGGISYQVNGEERSLDANLPAELANDAFNNRWHHIAMILKGRTIKLYIDQFRVVNVPQNTAVPTAVYFGGIATQEDPLIFKNVRIAEGGGANLIGQKFGEGKYISHGIRFDVGKATLRPESMGELSAIAKLMGEVTNSAYEIGGYTDSDGDDASNLNLSQARAEAVKKQLIALGINADRLTTKGYGETRPIADNSTPEGKAQNRRVEFVRQ